MEIRVTNMNYDLKKSMHTWSVVGRRDLGLTCPRATLAKGAESG